MAQRVNINGKAYTFNDLIINFGSVKLNISTDIPSLNSIDWGVKVDRKEYHGTGQFPLDVTKGPVTFDPLNMTFYTTVWQQIKASVGGLSALVGDTEMNVTLVLNKPGTADTFMWQFVGLYESEKQSLKVGSDAVTVNVTFRLLKINEGVN